MHAIIKTGGKQYRVTEGQTLKVESLDADVGASVELNEILMVSNGDEVKIGTPLLVGAKIMAEVVAHGRGKKIEIIKFKRRKHHMKRQGHRQNFTEIKVTAING